MVLGGGSRLVKRRNRGGVWFEFENASRFHKVRVGARETDTGAMEEPSSSLATIPGVLLPEVVRWLPSPLDVACLDCTSRLFHFGAPRSAVEVSFS